jgi:hypothetical protein
MLKRNPLVLAALASSAILLTASGALRADVLKENDQKKIAKEVASYWRATQDVKGIQSAYDKLSETMDKTQTRLKDQDLGALVGDWRKIFQYASIELLDDKTKKGKVEKGKGKDPKGEDLEYSYCTPKKYAPKDGPYPIVLIVPDEGADPTASLDADWADPELREAAVLFAIKMRTTSGDWGKDAGVIDVMSGLAIVTQTFALDYDRVFLAGTGKGFQAAAATVNAFPHLFAGLLGRGDVADANAQNLRNLPSFLAPDGGGAQAFKKRVDELGFSNCTIGANDAPAVLAWIQGHQREACPAHLTFAPTMQSARGAHWVRLDRMNVQEGPRVDARADRATNTITIDTQKVGAIEVSLNDELVDLSKTVKIVVNGVAHEGMIPRNRRTMIDLVYNQGDWGRVFTATQSYDVN